MRAADKPGVYVYGRTSVSKIAVITIIGIVSWATSRPREKNCVIAVFKSLCSVLFFIQRYNKWPCDLV